MQHDSPPKIDPIGHSPVDDPENQPFPSSPSIVYAVPVPFSTMSSTMKDSNKKSTIGLVHEMNPMMPGTMPFNMNSFLNNGSGNMDVTLNGDGGEMNYLEKGGDTGNNEFQGSGFGAKNEQGCYVNHYMVSQEEGGKKNEFFSGIGVKNYFIGLKDMNGISNNKLNNLYDNDYTNKENIVNNNQSNVDNGPKKSTPKKKKGRL